mmetsp:Transcript_113058/g.344039  ORF Transcript_113058/g.344039 Transcript_113058/m.344039 type:complete len:220 (+) Transcript_113058:61-720(+)
MGRHRDPATLRSRWWCMRLQATASWASRPRTSAAVSLSTALRLPRLAHGRLATGSSRLAAVASGRRRTCGAHCGRRREPCRSGSECYGVPEVLWEPASALVPWRTAPQRRGFDYSAASCTPGEWSCGHGHSARVRQSQGRCRIPTGRAMPRWALAAASTCRPAVGCSQGSLSWPAHLTPRAATARARACLHLALPTRVSTLACPLERTVAAPMLRCTWR